ncbi:hypothetical protein EDB83DRAFT_2362978 [Lactarius deliciosus]|nr:hypothetical protein EDB83DRAFT_2362978 [Lactarius deliciosus]
MRCDMRDGLGLMWLASTQLRPATARTPDWTCDLSSRSLCFSWLPYTLLHNLEYALYHTIWGVIVSKDRCRDTEFT